MAALLILRRHESLSENDEKTLESIKSHCIKVLSSYKHPDVWRIVEEIPKNTIGKVVKKDIVKLFN